MAFRHYPERLPHVILELDANPVTTRYFPLTYGEEYWEDPPRDHLTRSGEHLIETEEVDRTSYRLVSRKLPKGDLCEEDSDVTSQNQDGQRVYLENAVFYPSSLADGDRFLLLGENDDEIMRLLIAPREGRALVIKPLSLTFNEAKRRLEAEWGKRQAFRDKEIEETGDQNTVMEENRREKNEQRDERAGSASH
ncbi:hypothetical protein IMSHALPRED_003161 [Imshaugia aleurites]|uniref:Uncharacterized protein n=1 Tax=Imshaugia aleurites TaxID=172621 RepID=A0A8H3J734_9LECA|nr:hypothetical protein IMSHALPRED_003161 [Imshaugia aleurites]